MHRAEFREASWQVYNLMTIGKMLHGTQHDVLVLATVHRP
jgi:hypothetical protein